jgi:hypothetical protein
MAATSSALRLRHEIRSRDTLNDQGRASGTRTAKQAAKRDSVPGTLRKQYNHNRRFDLDPLPAHPNYLRLTKEITEAVMFHCLSFMGLTKCSICRHIYPRPVRALRYGILNRESITERRQCYTAQLLTSISRLRLKSMRHNSRRRSSDKTLTKSVPVGVVLGG